MTPERIERYRITQEISKNSQSTTYLAENEKNKQIVQLRLYPSGYFQSDEMRQTFELRGAILNRVSHSALIPVHQYGQYGDQPYIVSPVMEGGSLAEMLITHGRYKAEDIAPIVERIAEALDALHAQKAIHGKISPESVWFSADGAAYLGDFTMPAQPPDPLSDLSWHSPEFLKDGALHRQSDIYSLTVLVYKMLTGVTPFVGKTSSEISHLLLHGQIPSVGQIVQDNVEEIDQLFKIGMDYIYTNRPIFASEWVSRFKNVFRISTAVDQVATAIHGDLKDRSTKYNIIAESETSFDYEDHPDWMHLFNDPVKGVVQNGSSANVDRSKKFFPDVESNMTKVGSIETLDPTIVQAETGEANFDDTQIYEQPFEIEPAEEESNSLIGQYLTRRQMSGLFLAMAGMISLFALVAITLFILAVLRVSGREEPIDPPAAIVGNQPAEGIEISPDEPETDLNAEAEAAVDTTQAGDETTFDGNLEPAGLFVDIPNADKKDETDMFVWEFFPPSIDFLRRSRSEEFTLEEAGWYMYSNANKIRDVERIGNVIYAASGAGMTVWNLDSGEATRLTSYDGLAGNDINEIKYCDFVEPKLVVATESGISLLDPATLTGEIYDVAGRQLIKNQVKSIDCATTEEGPMLYVGYFNDGLTTHNLDTNKRDRIDRSDGLPTDSVEQILVVNGVIWINTGTALVQYDIETTESIFFSKGEGTLPAQNISEMAWDQAGTGLIWMSTNDGLMVGNSRGEFTLYTDENTNLPRGLGKSIAIDTQGIVWYGTSFGSMCAFSPQALNCDTIFRHPTNEFELESAITTIDVVDGFLVYGHRNDGVWIGSFIDRTSTDQPYAVKEWFPLILEDQFPTNEITALAAADGFVWIGTRRGLYKAPEGDLTGANWEYLDSENSEIPANWVTTLYPDPEGGMWVGTFRGAVYLGSVWLQDPIMVDQQIRAIVRDDVNNNIWLGTDTGVFQYNGRSVAEMRDLPTLSVRSLAWFGDDLYIGTEDGRVGVLTGGVFNAFDRTNSPLATDPVTAIAMGPNGSIYVGNGDDLYLINQARTLIPVPQVRGFYISDVLYQDRSNETLVATTSNSLYYYDSIDWTKITVRDGMATDRISDIVVDSLGTYWFASESLNEQGGGLVRYVPYPEDTQ
ncbi:MAG: protein kinase [Chloroflexota bacterium]